MATQTMFDFPQHILCAQNGLILPVGNAWHGSDSAETNQHLDSQNFSRWTRK